MSLQDQSPRPPRQVCHLTPAGDLELQRWLTEPVTRTREIRLEFLVKLYFAWQLDPALAHHLASEQREVMLRLADSISSQIAEDISPRANESDEEFGNLVLELRLEQTVSAASWLERVAQAANEHGLSH
jgi:PadR family transcriptional regulator AphA